MEQYSYAFLILLLPFLGFLLLGLLGMKMPLPLSALSLPCRSTLPTSISSL